MVGLVGLSWPSAIGTHLAVGTRVCFVPPGVLLSCTGHPFSQKDPATGIIVNCEARSGARDHSCKSQWTYSVMIDPMGWVCHGILSPEIFPVHLGRPNFVAAMNGFVSEAVLVPTKSSRGVQHLLYQPPRPLAPSAIAPSLSAIVATASRTNPVPVNAGGTGAAVPPAARTKSKNRLKPQRRAIKKVGRDSSGHRVCIHNIRLSLCKSCPGGGASLCEHQKQKCWCRVCGGSARCAHGKQRSRCVECGGAGICEHKKLRHRCVECGGAGICEHKKIRHRCSLCAACK
jgi:hypothetical protein